MLDDILLQVNKPAQYIGAEWNLAKKDFDKSAVKFALCFPDLYEVGMSNLGIRIIYGLLNSLPEVSCERFFSCASDMEGIIRSGKREFLSLESKRRLREFDFVGFSLGSELCYTNVLNILELGNIPLKADLRDCQYPLVIAGGPCTLNPEPMHEFFDIFVIGEAEDLILELINTYHKHKEKYKNGVISKPELLYAFSRIEGVYLPSFYEVEYNDGNGIAEFKPKIKNIPSAIKKRFVKDLNSAYFPYDWLMPYVKIIHDRLTIEIMRGCPNRCRFCQARSQYFPLRTRAIENILGLAAESYRRTGYEEISLCGLSVSDYPDAEGLLARLIDCLKDKAVSLSLPSMKAKQKVGSISSLIADFKKTGLTFAPEAGTARMREIIAKDFNEEEFFHMLEESYSSGYRQVKLYFMIGLPFERGSDLDAILEFSKKVSESRRKISGFPSQVNISINGFIPKPHTPFQWFAMDTLDSMKQKQEYLREKARRHLAGGRRERFKLNFHNHKMGFLEGVLSRGDRRLSEVILSAFKKGARFDAWSNHFAFELWQDAFTESKIEPGFYLKDKPRGSLLPWDFIDTGVKKESLESEFDKTVAIQ